MLSKRRPRSPHQIAELRSAGITKQRSPRPSPARAVMSSTNRPITLEGDTSALPAGRQHRQDNEGLRGMDGRVRRPPPQGAHLEAPTDGRRELSVPAGDVLRLGGPVPPDRKSTRLN